MTETSTSNQKESQEDKTRRSKLIREILANIFAITCVCMLLLSSCNRSTNGRNNALIGSWTPQKSSTAPWGYPDVFTLNADGTGKCDGYSIYDWTTHGHKLIIETSYEYLEYEYKLSFGKLTLDGVPYKKS